MVHFNLKQYMEIVYKKDGEICLGHNNMTSCRNIYQKEKDIYI